MSASKVRSSKSHTQKLRLETLGERITPAVGALDATYGADGIINTNFGADEQSKGQVIQPDGKIVVVGFTGFGSSVDFAMIRYNVDGSLDTSFGSGGKVTTSFGTGTDIANAVALQGDGKIVVVGSSVQGSNNDVAMARYNPNGTLDTTFSGDGKLTIPSAGDASATSVAVHPTGAIVVVGTSTSSNADFAFWNVSTTGSLSNSSSFAIGSGNDFANDVVIQPSGRIVIAGTSTSGSNEDFALLGINLNGNRDSTFGTNGVTITDFSNRSDRARSVAMAPNGTIMAVGTSDVGGGNFAFAFAKYTPNGALDISLNGTGKTTVDFGSGSDEAFDVALDSNNYWVAVGYTTNGSNKNLALADDFGGALVSDLGSNDDGGAAIAFQADGKPVIAGQTISGTYDFALVRYNTIEGYALDKTLASGPGYVTTDFGSSNDTPKRSALQSDGKLIVVGQTVIGTFAAISVVRYNVDGSLDTSFDADGKYVYTTTNNVFATSVGIQSDGKIVIGGGRGGNPSRDFFLLRLSTAGLLDTSFGSGGIVIDNAGGFDRLMDLVIQADDQIVAVGASDNNAIVRQYSSSGAFLTGASVLTFGASSMAFNKVAIAPNGKVVAAGVATISGDDHFFVGRTSSSNLSAGWDAGFQGGFRAHNFNANPDAVQALVVQSDGRIVVGGYASTGIKNEFALLRLTEDGFNDISFDDDGAVTTTFGPSNGAFNADISDLAMLPDGKLLAVGARWTGGVVEVAMARYNTNGSPDTSFNGSGKATISAPSGWLDGQDVELLSNGRMLISGYTKDGGGNQDFFSMRLMGDNRAPESAFDSKSVSEDNTLSSTLNSTDPDGDVVTTKVVSLPLHGSVTLTPYGGYTYTPEPNYFGTDSFTYEIRDIEGLTSTGQVNVTVNPVNDAPTRTAGTIGTLIVPTGSPMMSLGLGGLSYSPGLGESDSLTFKITTLPAGLGTVYLADSTTAVVVNASYTLTQLQGMQIQALPSVTSSTANFAWTADDGNGGTLGESLTIKNASVTITNVPTTPITAVPGYTVQVDANATTSNVSGSSHRFSLLNAPAGASINPDTGLFTWAMDGFLSLGTYSITVRAEDKSYPIAFATQSFDVSLVRTAIIDNGLFIGGTNSNDLINLTMSSTTGTYTARLGRTILGTFPANAFNYIVAFGLNGNDTISIAPNITLSASLYGGAGNDRLTGGGGTNLIQGDDGNDTLTGGSSDDTVYGGTGNDRLIGGAGVNQMFGEDGNDSLTGGVGNEFLDGGAGNDTLNGGAGDDSLFGNTGRDNLIGGNGNNYLSGGDDNDTLTGGTGRDVMVGGLGSDSLNGSTGEDLLIGGQVAFDLVFTFQFALNEWFSPTTSYFDRIDHLEGTLSGGLNGSAVINSTTATNDGSIDTLVGGLGNDYFVHSSTDLFIGLLSSEIGFLVV